MSDPHLEPYHDPSARPNEPEDGLFHDDEQELASDEDGVRPAKKKPVRRLPPQRRYHEDD